MLSLFSFHGRSRRTSYGIFFAITIAAYFVLSVPYTIWSIQRNPEQFRQSLKPLEQTNPAAAHMFDPILNMPHDYAQIGLYISAAILLVLYIAWIAVSVRRLHDIKLTGWLVLIAVIVALVPLVGYLLVSLILGFWPGTKGANRYGPDPRQPDIVPDVFGRESMYPRA